MMSTQTELGLYPFQSASLKVVPVGLHPPLYRLTVSGETGSLNPVIELRNTHLVEGGYLVVEVLGQDGAAIGSTHYQRSIDFQEVPDTLGVVVTGKGKSEKLDWGNVRHISDSAATGLFFLPLKSVSNMPGAPVVNLRLTVDSVNNTVNGLAVVTQALAHPVVCKSSVSGNLIHETVMSPGTSRIRIDLTGYPEIHFPPNGGIGPVVPKNFTAMILFDTDWSNGTIQYQYLGGSGWIKENQPIEIQAAMRIAA